MAKQKELYVCEECGHESAKWMGKCPICGAWNSFSAVTPLGGTAAAFSRGKTGVARPAPVSSIREDISCHPVYDRIVGTGPGARRRIGQRIAGFAGR